MHHIPASPIKVYNIRLTVAAEPPKSHETQSNPNIPTEPQLRAPTMIKISDNLSSISLSSLIIKFINFTNQTVKKYYCLLEFNLYIFQNSPYFTADLK